MSWATVAFCVLSAAAVALSAIDLKTHTLPRAIIYVAAALGLPFLFTQAWLDQGWDGIINIVFGAGLALAIMGTIYVGSRGGMGDGDVRLSPLLGAYIGFINPGVVPVALFFGFFLGAIVGVAALARKQASGATAVPFGPFLFAGTLLAVQLGQPFVDLLLHR